MNYRVEFPSFSSLKEEVQNRVLEKVRAGESGIWLEDYVPPYFLIMVLSGITDNSHHLHIGMSNEVWREEWEAGIARLNNGRKPQRRLVQMMSSGTRAAVDSLYKEKKK